VNAPIDQTVADWHRLLRGKFPGGLDELLHDDVVFVSPIVFSPQKGKELTKLYLLGAFASFGSEGESSAEMGDVSSTSFHYVKEVVAGNHAVLEFESEVKGTVINGVDIITVDDDGKIIEFKVMLRPLKAINLMHQMMANALETLTADSESSN
jgi:hypothetical protein